VVVVVTGVGRAVVVVVGVGVVVVVATGFVVLTTGRDGLFLKVSFFQFGLGN